MAKSNSKKIVKVHDWSGTLKRIELECGHTIERSVHEGRPLPKSNKLTCGECTATPAIASCVGHVPDNAPKLRKTLNELARKLYANIGYQAKEGFDFQNSNHPQERAMFAAACIAYEHFNMNRGRIFWRNQLQDWVGK